jgi:hypothetical protein
MQAFPPEPRKKLTKVGPLRVSLLKRQQTSTKEINASGLLAGGQDPPLGGQIMRGRRGPRDD